MIHRNIETQKRWKKKAKGMNGYAPWGYYYDSEQGRYIKTHTNPNSYKKFMRKRNNKRIRKCQDVGDGADYRKKFEHWWDIY